MFRIFSILIIFISLSSCLNQKDERPNVIVILTDDQGSVDVNVYGAKDLATPGIDKLASEGVRFSRFYVGSAICSPSRAAILTGLTPQSAGVPGNVSSIPGNPGMLSEIETLAEVFAENGYSTGHVGKWHLGYTKETSPLAQGFDYSFGHMGGCIDNYSHFFYWNGPNRHDLWENGKEIFMDGQYFPDLMAQKAEKYIKSKKENPFFLYYAINTPHYPLQPRPEWREYYKEMDMPRRDYAGFVSTADQNIEDITELLDNLGIRENTIVIYLSDHGHSYETRTFGGGGSAGPFRGGKTSLFEGGIRVPAIISWPGSIPEGIVNNEIAHSIDIMPTLLSLCDIRDVPEQLEGLDISPALSGDSKIPERTLFWKLGSQWAVRKGAWKLIGLPKDPSKKGKLNPENDRLFLTNLETDSTEMENLASKYPDKVEEMIGEYLTWTNSSREDIPERIVKINNTAVGAGIKLLTKPSGHYNAGGGETLIDGKIGSRSHDDGFWLGYEGRDLHAIIDLKGSKQINSLEIRFLNSPESWIFSPERLQISYSIDGNKYTDPTEIVSEYDQTELSVHKFISEIPVMARHIRVEAQNIKVNPDWHSNPGGKSWIFCDEIIIN